MEVGPHNTYLWLLVETGLIGLFIYSLFLLCMAVYLLRLLRALSTLPEAEEVRSFVAAFASYFLVYHFCEEMFMSQVVSFGGHAYFLAAMAFGTSEFVSGLPNRLTQAGADRSSLVHTGSPLRPRPAGALPT
jgi:O-antigen ligase